MKKLIASALVTFAALTQFAGSAIGQTTPAPSAAPLTDREVNLLITAAAITSCGLAVNKVAYDMSVANASGTVVKMIYDLNGGKIPGVNKTLTKEQSFQAVSTEVALRTLAICPKVLSEETTKQLKAVIEQRKAASSSKP